MISRLTAGILFARRRRNAEVANTIKPFAGLRKNGALSKLRAKGGNVRRSGR